MSLVRKVKKSCEKKMKIGNIVLEKVNLINK